MWQILGREYFLLPYPWEAPKRLILNRVKDSYSFKNRADLSINCGASENLLTEITNNKSENITFNVVYRPPRGDIDVCENYFKNIFFKDDVISKTILLVEILKELLNCILRIICVWSSSLFCSIWVCISFAKLLFL